MSSLRVNGFDYHKHQQEADLHLQRVCLPLCRLWQEPQTMNDPFLRLGPFLLEDKNKAGNYIAQVPHVDGNVWNLFLFVLHLYVWFRSTILLVHLKWKPSSRRRGTQWRWNEYKISHYICLLFHQATPYTINNKIEDFSYERTSKVWKIPCNLKNWKLNSIKTDFLQQGLNRCTISASEETTWSTSSQRDLNAPWASKCTPQENLMSQRTIRSTHILIVHVSNFLSKELSKYCNTWIDVTFR